MAFLTFLGLLIFIMAVIYGTYEGLTKFLKLRNDALLYREMKKKEENL